MTNEELDEARAKEAWRLWNDEDGVTDEGHAVIAARLAREGWTPPEPVDPDVLAFEQWFKGALVARPEFKEPYLAGACMAREQEQERAKVLVDALDYISRYSRNYAKTASAALAAYKAGRTAR
jgi:hypothetical protein